MKNYYRIFKTALLFSAFTGLGLYILKYWMKVDTGYGLRPHPLQADFQHFHLFFVPWLVLAVGILIPVHIKSNINKLKKRKTGILLIIFFILMMLTGPLLQFSFNPLILEGLQRIHQLSSFSFLIIFLLHWNLKKF